MQANPTYPGVYVDEISSGVRTITGVSTSVAAFLGKARTGPINKPERILSFADYERKFGGLDSNSEMSYAVLQFFNNGGSNAWVVRLAKNTISAALILNNRSTDPVLSLTALNAGFDGNNIRVSVDPIDNSSGFDLTLEYRVSGRRSIVERFENLSMNSKDPHYVVDQINQESKLVKAERPDTVTLPEDDDKGFLESGDLSGVGDLVDEHHNQFRISINGLPAITILLTSDNLEDLAEQILDKVSAEENEALTNFTYEFDDTGTAKKLKMISGKGGEFSTVRVLPGVINDISGRLKLRLDNGGTEKDAIESIRPVLELARGQLISGDLSEGNLPDLAVNNSFNIQLNGGAVATITISVEDLTGTDNEKYEIIADRIETEVRAQRLSDGAFTEFTCQYNSTSTKFILESGTRGKGSSVMVFPANENDLAASLQLLSDSGAAYEPVNSEPMLENGFEDNNFDLDAYNVFIGSEANREGIYALESVDLFNLLCLPGVTDTAILGAAANYSQQNRAFLITDSPAELEPNDLLAKLADYPKSNYAAVYYPWIKIPDSQKNGQDRLTSPSGTMAGIYARTDSQRGVWKAPAGIESSLKGVQELEYKLTDGQNGFLNPKGVNCLRQFPASGRVVWGARTLRGDDGLSDEYKYIPVRRLALFIEESLYRGTQWVVFEPNDEPLWSQIRLNIGAFMRTLFRQGAFQGTAPRAAYFVKCDSETTTQDDINNGIVNIVVGFAPLKPAEFVIIKIQQIAGDIQV